MKAKRTKPQKTVKIIYWSVLAILIGWILLWSTNSFYRTHRLKRELSQLNAKTERLIAQNDSLRAENEKLMTNLDAAEKAARERFGLIKPGEKVFRFIPAPEVDKK